jgi:hypothetical protein
MEDTEMPDLPDTARSSEATPAVQTKLAEDCPCVQAACPIRGDCVQCVGNHRRHGRHLPECLQPLVRPLLEELAGKVELGVVDKRPTPELWEKRRG